MPDRRVWDTSEKLHNRQVLSSLEKAMFVLPDDKRLVILLRYYENKTQHEIAETLGWTRDKVQYQLEKALDTMRRFMSDDHPPDPDGGGISARPKESCETEKQDGKTRAKHVDAKTLVIAASIETKGITVTFLPLHQIGTRHLASEHLLLSRIFQ